MATTKVILRSERANPKGLAPLYLRITHQRKSRYFSLETFVHKKHWDESTGLLKPKAPNSQELNAWLLQKQAELHTAWVKESGVNKKLKVDEIKEKVYGVKEMDFFQVAKEDYNAFLEKGKVNTWIRSVSIINKFQEFLKTSKMPFNKITLETIKDFEKYCRGVRKNKTNSIQRDMKYIRKMFILAEKSGWIEPKQNPFNFYKIDYEPTPVSFLKLDQIKAFEELEEIKTENEQLYHDIFLFTVYGIGLRVSDNFLLRRKNYDGKSIEVVAKKTGEQIYINLTQKAKAILDKYIHSAMKPDDFIFPVLKGHEKTTDMLILNQAIQSKTAVYNKVLDKFAKRLEFGGKLTTHVARHTWATRAGQLGVKLEIIQAILGHSNIQQTMRYRHLINEELNNAISILE